MIRVMVGRTAIEMVRSVRLIDGWTLIRTPSGTLCTSDVASVWLVVCDWVVVNFRVK